MRVTHHSIRPIVATVVAAAFFLPVYAVLVNVFKPADQIVADPLALPIPATLDNLAGVLSRSDRLYWQGMINSIQITAISIVLVTVLSAMLGYFLARTASVWASVVFAVLLAGLMIPPAVILQPITSILNSLGLMNTIAGLVLVNVGYYLPFGVLVFRGFTRTIPFEIEQAALIDGAGRSRVFWQVVFPLMRPAAASALIFFGVWIWNDFLNPLYILGPSTGTTVTVGIYRSLGEHSSDYGAVFAFMFLASFPILVFYLLLQNQFIKGLTGGASK